MGSASGAQPRLAPPQAILHPARDRKHAGGRLDGASDEPAFGRGHPQVSVARQSLVTIDAERGHHEAAVEAFIAVAADTEAVMGSEHRFVGAALHGAGQSLLELGRAREAVDALERALRILEESDDGEELAELRFDLARALREAGRGSTAAARGHTSRDPSEVVIREGR